MTDFSSTKQTLYSTSFDVRSLLNIFKREVEDEDEVLIVGQKIADARIEQYIINADSIILGYLIGVYGASALNSQSPYFIGPVPVDDNTSDVGLAGVIVASTAITEQWIIKFTDTDTFTLTGSMSGYQGSGGISSDFTSTNSLIQIKAEDWSTGEDSAVDEGNILVFGTYTTHKLIRTLSAKLAAADLVTALYQGTDADVPGFAKTWRKDVMDLLKQLVDPNSEVSLDAVTSEDVSDMAVGWDIDAHGQDVSKYGSFTNDVNPMDI